ncbi:MAG: type II toxin-antitoxin system RelE/ParE family toxin [Spirochaetales bacterium]|nr:type II toxin-antitoxin system RelE/ParE family toxin [Spirochaetales bacterium]
MAKVIFSPSAEEDLIEIVKYYREIDLNLARKIFNLIKKKAQSLKNNPKRGRIVPELEKQNIIDYRELVEGNYRIIYSVKEYIMIHTIVDSRRNLEDILIKKLHSVIE